MNARVEPADQLRALAEHLEPGLARHLRALVAADSHARTCQDLAGRAERAEDLVAEFRRQHEPLLRNADALNAEVRKYRTRCHGSAFPHSPACESA